MNILGVTHPISWNPAACLLVDGKLVAFAEEERFLRLKHAPNMPADNAVAFCLAKAGLSKSDIAATAIGFADPRSGGFDSDLLSAYLEDKLNDQQHFKMVTDIGLLHAENSLTVFGQRRYFDHHLCHTASTALPAGFERTNCITLDGWGGESSGRLGYFDKHRGFETFERIAPEQSWGMTFELITEQIGFRCHSGEGKTMGLASYGEFDQQILPDFCEPVFGLPDVRRYEAFLATHLPKRQENAPILTAHKNMAATLQRYYERSLLRIAQWLSKKTGSRNFALAGGVALNCTANGVLARSEFVDELFVQPASHDAGTALGAAILAHHELAGHWPDVQFEHCYFGPSYDGAEVRKALDFANVDYEEGSGALLAAEALARNEVVGWFQGAAEVGPRALGNRSILAHPGIKNNLDRVNLRVKRREPWRPLAPSVLADRYSEVFEGSRESPYMLLAVQVAQQWRSRIPAVVHIDGSARPQSVSVESNKRYYNLIEHFERLTGLPVVLNTSFNMNDEPLVNSPEQALATFFRSGMDTLVIDDFVVRKQKSDL